MSDDQKSNAAIGLIAGGRCLPFRFADWAKQNGRDLYIIGVKGEVDEKLKNEVSADKYEELSVCEVSKGIKFFQKHKVDEIVMIGGIARAKLKLNFDIIRIISRLLFIKNKHKGVFSVIISIFAKAGIKVRAIQDLIPDLLISEGSLGKFKPSDDDFAVFKKKLPEILDYTHSGAGQAVIICKGEILAYESFRGTDDLIRRAAAKRRKISGELGGIMIKIMEPGQDARADFPVIGTGTIEILAKYGLDGVIVEAGRAITDDLAKTVKLADEKGIFIYGANQKYFE
jgi:DUF1009 family protein